MDITLKQRLVGVMVLISLGIIFLPSLFYRDTGERTVVDTQSLIPPKPAVRTIVIEPPNATQQTPAAKPDEAFQPPTEHLLSVSSSNAEVEDKKPSESPAEQDVSSKTPKKENVDDDILRLDASGLPESWVIQAASFQSKEHADVLMNKLRGKNLKAYVRPVKTAKGQFFRVLIGPYISQSRAKTDKAIVDKAYKVKGQILRFSSK